MQLTGQADLKGSIIITASAIVVSVSVTQFNDADLRWSLVTLVAFVLLALLELDHRRLPEVQDPPRARRPAAARLQPVLLRALLADHQGPAPRAHGRRPPRRPHDLPGDGRGHLRPGRVPAQEQVPLPALQLRVLPRRLRRRVASSSPSPSSSRRGASIVGCPSRPPSDATDSTARTTPNASPAATATACCSR